MGIKPILFNTEMVRAIQEGRKTETRRLIQPKYRDDECGFRIVTRAFDGAFVRVEIIDNNEFCTRYLQPKYSPGDVLWVRETWAIAADLPGISDGGLVYMADYNDTELKQLKEKNFRWCPSIHMPKEAAREFLKVNAVRAEPLRKITAAGIRAEGISARNAFCGNTTGRSEFRWLWNSTIPKDKLPTYGWHANPWVWVYQFERCEKPKEWC